MVRACRTARARQGHSVGVGILDPELRQYLGFETLHLKGLVILDVIIPQNVQESMHHEMGEMMVEGFAEVPGLALDGFAGQRNVTENAENRRERLDLRKGKHVG